MRADVIVLAAWFLIAACDGDRPCCTPPPDPEPVLTPDELPLECDDGVLLQLDGYRVENNAWGKGDLTGWAQCVGAAQNPDGSIVARFTWDWLESGGSVKAYPEIIYGYKPSGSTTTPLLPKRVSDIQELTARYDLDIQHIGSGNTAFDIWLTNTQTPTSFAAPPITHEIMVWLESYGSMVPGGSLRERAVIAGTAFDVYVGEMFGAGWRYIAFRRVQPPPAADTVDLHSLLVYAQQANLITGSEYLASIEFGNEVVSGMGDTKINAYAVEVK